MAGECNRLLAHSLHEIAIGGEHIGVMVHDRLPELCSQMALGNCHAHGIAKPLAQWPGCSLDPLGDKIFGVSGSN